LHHTATLTARDEAGDPYLIDIWCEQPVPAAGEAPVPAELRHRGTLVEWVSRGVYRVQAGFTPTGREVVLTSDDPNAP
jgi:hypothetical protein